MSYTALYRKFRPKQFEDVKGQDHIVTTLQNQIKADRIGHAYLFCGTRGTGKTTVAKIFAKAVNCEHPVNGSPCGECQMCRAIESGSFVNVVEIDAASNNGVDNIREIREEVAYRPTSGRYKVYIIDEVHMLSPGAFNALLKTLEEPPEYVIFILATTELHKIPITILSRCQQYHFKRIGIDTIASRVDDLMKIEKVDIEEQAVRYIAKAADGSMRDALSLLDQCIAFYLGQKLTYDMVLEVLGTVDTEVFSRLLRNLIARDVTKVLETVEELTMLGKELSQVTTDFIWYLRNLLLVKTSDNIEDVLDVSTENLKQLKEESQMIELDMLLRYIRIFSELSGQMKYASQKRVLLEVALIKVCTPAMERDEDSLLDRIRVLEEKVEKGEFAVAAQPRRHFADDEEEETKTSHAQPAKQIMADALPEDIREAVKSFRGIAEEASGLVRTILHNARPSYEEGNPHLLIVVKKQLDAEALRKKERVEEIESLIANRIGTKVEIEIRCLQEGQSFSDAFADIEKSINMDIIVED